MFREGEKNIHEDTGSNNGGFSSENQCCGVLFLCVSLSRGRSSCIIFFSAESSQYYQRVTHAKKADSERHLPPAFLRLHVCVCVCVVVGVIVCVD